MMQENSMKALEKYVWDGKRMGHSLSTAYALYMYFGFSY